MRPFVFSSVVGALTLFPAIGRAPTPAAVAPCTTPTTACEQWDHVRRRARPGRWFTRPTRWTCPNPAITRALIMVHGTGRNADHYFETAPPPDSSPARSTTPSSSRRTSSRRRTNRSRTKSMWPDGGDSWRSGGMSPTNPTISAFDFVDEIVRKLANKKTFPNLTKIVVAGHSAGGQVRHAIRDDEQGPRDAGGEHHVRRREPVELRLARGGAAVADERRGPRDGRQGGARARPAKRCTRTFSTAHSTPRRRPTTTVGQPASRIAPATRAGPSNEQLKKQLVDRPTTYLLGQVDVLPLGGFDSSPNAMAQGPTRRARGEAFFKYVTETLGAKHNAIIVPECGHNDRCIFTTDIVFPVIFPK